MESADEQDLQVKKDLANLTRALTAENLNPVVMFSACRGIRSCMPPFETAPAAISMVSDRLKRIPVQPAE